jgi:hypothetical protein
MGQRVVLTDHAAAEARRRGISEATVLRVATTPEQSLGVRTNREIRQSRVIDPASGKLHLVRVVVDLEGDADIVVTVYRTSKVRKYWRGE